MSVAYAVYEALDSMKGKQLASIAHDALSVTFTFTDGSRVTFDVAGECCSRSWIEHLETPRDLEGATVVGWSESDMDVRGECTDGDYPDQNCLKVYRTTINTNRGEIVLEYRNSSNGYYGGSLELASDSDEGT